MRSERLSTLRRVSGDSQNYVIGDTYSVANDGLKGRVLADVAEERGQDAFPTLMDIVLADELRTILWPGSSNAVVTIDLWMALLGEPAVMFTSSRR